MTSPSPTPEQEDFAREIYMQVLVAINWPVNDRIKHIASRLAEREKGRGAPSVSAELEDFAVTDNRSRCQFLSKALNELADQLGYGNDFCVPLRDAANVLLQIEHASPAPTEAGEGRYMPGSEPHLLHDRPDIPSKARLERSPLDVARISELEGALRFYADPKSVKPNGKWEDDYPGGITYDEGGVVMLDNGEIASEALALAGAGEK